MKNLTPRQMDAIPHVVTASSIAEGCRSAGITRTTFYKWMREPSFKEEVARHRNKLVEDGMEILKGHFARAVEALVGLLATEAEGLRRQVAMDVIGHVLKLKEMTDIEGRLDAIEKTLAEFRSSKLNS
jgi:transposase-like protein